MEVAVITRHAIANYGSLLQAAATQNALEALGHNCRIIDYVRPGEVCTQLHKSPGGTACPCAAGCTAPCAIRRM